MSVKIGGFAAFMIAIVVAGGIERVVHTVVNRPKPKRKSDAQEAFWKALHAAIVETRNGPNYQTTEDFREVVNNKVAAAFTAATIDARDRKELDDFLSLLQAKWDVINAG
ncbi:hypothetical protein FDI21_gp112 [Pseudomonas phage Noxifer]|uniref:Uncharacterized protein n=1 Tax=Pseudomonas phage Noxifer TaxID=2006684 RepID=A0A1Y0SUU9_9CAUD|nr:hypothetical protein FDI21_gp112 [Pseudomonas phage Noxifer]ARV77281.1 hypothetical protein NOXIFER_112 [Pseudomonas phage Noxifer]